MRGKDKGGLKKGERLAPGETRRRSTGLGFGRLCVGEGRGGTGSDGRVYLCGRPRRPRLQTGALLHPGTSASLHEGERLESVLRGLGGKCDWTSPRPEERVEEKRRPQGPAGAFLAYKVVVWERDRHPAGPSGQNKETRRKFVESLI